MLMAEHTADSDWFPLFAPSSLSVLGVYSLARCDFGRWILAQRLSCLSVSRSTRLAYRDDRLTGRRTKT